MTKELPENWAAKAAEAGIEAWERQAELAQAVCDVMAKIKRLEKADLNQFAKYNFTSVDDFKDDGRPLLAAHGLTVIPKEKKFKLSEHQGKKQNETVLLATVKYTMTLQHINGAKGDPEPITIILPYVGAQTSGAARSYAIKEWWKGRFMASSGDVDTEADLNNQDMVEGMRLGKEAARELEKELRRGMKDAIDSRDSKRLAKWGFENKSKIQTLPKDWHIKMQNDYAEEMDALKAIEAADKIDPDKLSNAELDQLAQDQ